MGSLSHTSGVVMCLSGGGVGVLGDDPLDPYQYGEPTPWHSKYNPRGGTGI